MKHLLVILCLSFAIQVNAQDKKKKDWIVNEPPYATKDVNFTVDEGTWINLDVSPDGSQIVFDLLGDIYRIPTSGGKAKLLRGGIAYEVQPRFSPKGDEILFTSDVEGGDNLFRMDLEGNNVHQITKESFRLLNNGVWMPDGNYVVGRKHFTSTRSLGAGEMWMYHRSGGGGVQLTKRKNDQQDVNEPCISPDGKYMYFSEDVYPGGYFQYNKDPNDQIFVIKRFEFASGDVEVLIGGPGGAVRPEISPNGRYLSFIRRVRTKTVLYVHDLETGEQWPVHKDLSKDQMEAWTIFGVYTGYGWMPDNEHVVIWAEGKLKKIHIHSREASIIPFEADVSMKVAETLTIERDPDPDDFEVKVIRHATTSPDGKTLVFNALGHLWSKSLPNGKAKRMTSNMDFEFDPAFSKDGRKMAYVTWNDETTGGIWVGGPKANGARKIEGLKGILRQPRFSPNGQMIVFRKEGGNGHQGYNHSKMPGVYVVKLSGGKAKRISKAGYDARFSAAGDRVFYTVGWGKNKTYKSVNLEGYEERTHIKSTYGKQFTPSPDNKWIAFSDLHKVYIAAFPPVGKTIDMSSSMKNLPVAQVAQDEGINLHWSADSKSLRWTYGNEYYDTPLENRFKFLRGDTDELPALDTIGSKIDLRIKTDRPKGAILLTNARVITMNSNNDVIENGSVFIEGNRIKWIKAGLERSMADDVTVIDCKGKTIMPGLVDVHAHLGTFRQGMSPQKQWSYYANLAFGVTTTHDPSVNSEMTFAQAEMVQAGEMVGPRVYSTGRILYGADGDFKAPINNLNDARSAVRRTKKYGAFSVKSYNQPRRNQRQQVMKAARELDIMVVPEGGSFFYHNMSMVIDGHTGVEHNIPVAPLHDDVIKLWASTKAHNTPTLVVSYGAVSGEFYFYQKTNVWENKRLLKYVPRAVIDSRSRHRKMIPDEEYENGHILISKSLKKLQDAGVNINLGSHGQLQGLAAHWELWMFAQGGMDNMQVLRCGTINGAEYIGMDKDLGSLESGKLADIIILDKNPLENIRNTESVKYTIMNGRIYDAESMNEFGNESSERSKFYWETEKYNDNFPWYAETHSAMQPKCLCGKN